MVARQNFEIVVASRFGINIIFILHVNGQINVAQTVQNANNKRTWTSFNSGRGAENERHVGEDNLWEWEHVVKYKMWWLAAISK